MARCLVTGHKGYIGSKVYARLKELGHEVQGIDLFEGNDILAIFKEYSDGSGRFHPYYYDFKPEYVFHLACIPRVVYSVENPAKTMKNNVLAATYVLNFARKIGAKRVIYSGSSSVVGNGNGPSSPYGLQKLISEMECKLYSDLYGLDTVSLRYFNVYSPDQEAAGPYATAIANWMQCIRSGKTPYITGDGEQRRDMLHVSSAVDANIFCMECENNFNGQHFDVGTGTNISLNEIKNIVHLFHPKTKFDYVDPRPGDVIFTKADTSAMAEIGWKAKISIHEGVRGCFNF